jgi:hypothetical protein
MNKYFIPMGCILLRGVHVNNVNNIRWVLKRLQVSMILAYVNGSVGYVAITCCEKSIIRNTTVASAGKTYIVYIIYMNKYNNPLFVTSNNE